MQEFQTVAWTEKYRPKSMRELLGNEEAVAAFKAWLMQWMLKKKPTKACLLSGPPGVGKTSLARAGANDFNFRVLEMNASDVRTEKTIKTLLAPARVSLTLDRYSLESRGNLILMDEVDGVFGREDRGGLGAILTAIKQSPIPVVLTANNVDDERFDDLKKACVTIQLYEIRPRILLMLIEHILTQEHLSIPKAVAIRIARESYGDIRSAVNDAQAIATGGQLFRPLRTRELDEKSTVTRLFNAKGPGEARRVLNETEVPLYRDELLLLLHDLLPYVYTTPNKLAKAYDSLSRADLGYGRIGASRTRGMMPPPFNLPRRDRPPEWSLLPVALNEIATVGTAPVDSDVLHALDMAPRISRKAADRYQYRLWALDHLCARLARACHLSKKKAVEEVLPSLLAIFQIDPDRGREIAVNMGAEERDLDFLSSESKTQAAPKGPSDILDPAGFKLAYMGKDKFIQLMRAGISYDRSRGMFAVRRLDDLDSVEERLTGILAKPIKFKRSEAVAEEVSEKIVKVCYVDDVRIACEDCEFVEDCPTHTIEALKYCVCERTLSDTKGYAKYVEKNEPASTKTGPKRMAVRKKR